MDEWLESLVPWGSEVIAWVQAHSFPALDAVSRFFTVLGYEELYLLLLPLVYWCLSREIGIGLGYLSMLSAWLNSAVKYVFAVPRPSGPGIEMKAPRPEPSPSFPSGHAQNAVANWGYLAVRFRRRALWVAAGLLILGIGLSRIVLGVHFPQDILGGWLIKLCNDFGNQRRKIGVALSLLCRLRVRIPYSDQQLQGLACRTAPAQDHRTDNHQSIQPAKNTSFQAYF